MKKIIGKIKKILVVFLRKNQPLYLSNKIIYKNDIKVKGDYIIATKNGLYIWRQSALHLILKGDFYGVAYNSGTIYVYQLLYKHGRILKFNYSENIKKIRVEKYLKVLNPGCHQIDIHNNYLYVTNTYDNSILKVSLENKEVQCFHPFGRLDNERKSHNYKHINSILYKNDSFYLMCHNETIKTNKHSEIYHLNESFEIVDKINTSSGNAHNVVIYKDDLFHCDSYKMTLKCNENVVYICNHFTRGLSISEDYIFVGGSDYAKREDRRSAKGHLYILNHKYEDISSLEIPGMVQEIRRIDKIDYGLSNANI